MKRILIADDEAIILIQLEEALKAMGYDVAAVASTGADAIDLARTHTPDIVLMDIVMPGKIDGIDACKIIQDELSIPVVLVSAYSNEANLTRARAAAPHGYVVKPFQADQIKVTVETALELSERRQLVTPALEHHIPSDQHSDLLATILESRQFGAALANEQGHIFHMNRKLTSLSGYPADAFDNMPDLLATLFPNLPSTHTASHPICTPLTHKNGELMDVETRITPLRTGGTMLVVTDISLLTNTRRALDAHQRLEHLKRRIADAFLTHEETDVFEQVCHLLEEAFRAEFSYFGYINESGDLVVPSFSQKIWSECSIPEKTMVFTKTDWVGIWGDSLREKEIKVAHGNLSGPCGHVKLTNAIALPIIRRGALIGQIVLANRPGGFSDTEITALRSLADYLAPVLAARIERERLRTRRNDIEYALMASEAMYRRIVETSLEGIWTIDKDRRTTYANNNLANMLGYQPEDLLGRPISQFMDEQALDEFNRRLEKTQNGFSAQFDFRFLHALGQGIWTICSTSPLTGQDGSFQGTLLMTSDITHRKFAETSLLESEERFRQLVENLSEVFIIRDLQSGKGLYASPSYEQVWGLHIDDFYAQPMDFLKAIHPEDLEIIQERQIAFQKHPASYSIEYRIIRGGQVRWLRTRVSPITTGKDITRVASVTEDITQSRKAARERDRLARAIEQVSELVVITNKRGTILYANPAFEELSGYTRNDFAKEKALFFGLENLESSVISDISNMLGQERPWSGTIPFKTADDTEHILSGTITPVHDFDGNLANYVSVYRDITDELAMQTQLNQSHKMEALGTLAGGIAHDFNNILMAIMGFNELAMRQAPDESRLASHLERVAQAGARARDLVQQILTFSRRNEFELRSLDIIPLIKEALRLLKATLPANVSIRQDIQLDKALVMADPGQIQQIIMNLCTNAAHALKKNGGNIQVSIGRVVLTRQAADALEGVHPGSHIEICVGDTGTGIPEDVMEKIFDPFFTTKLPGEGTGMGLAVVHGTTKQLEGDITVRSSQGVGTVFTVYLPEAAPQTNAAAFASAHATGNGEHLLFVDDEDAITLLASQGLTAAGYEVSTFNTPQQALEAFRAEPNKFKALITDIAMPGMNGDQMAKQMVALRPDLPILLCTGNAGSLDLAPLPASMRILLKPLSLSELTGTIREMLDQTEGLPPLQQ